MGLYHGPVEVGGKVHVRRRPEEPDLWTPQVKQCRLPEPLHTPYKSSVRRPPTVRAPREPHCVVDCKIPSCHSLDSRTSRLGPGKGRRRSVADPKRWGRPGSLRPGPNVHQRTRRGPRSGDVFPFCFHGSRELGQKVRS